PIVDLARKHFAADVRALSFSLVATAIALGAALGVGAELLVFARRTFRGGLSTAVRRTVARIAVVALLHLTLFAWGVARMPQLYTDKLYLREGSFSSLARTGQIVVADVLRPDGVLAIAAFFAVSWAAPYPNLAWLRRRGPALLGGSLA